MNAPNNLGYVAAVCRKPEPGLPKEVVDSIQLIEDRGVVGDYHFGGFIPHRYLAKKDPPKPNLRQVLLIDTTIIEEVGQKNIQLLPGMLGENIIVDGINVMQLDIGALLEVGQALVEISEVRNPCLQLNEIHPELLKAVAYKENGVVQKNAGMMARIIKGGWVYPGDHVREISV